MFHGRTPYNAWLCTLLLLSPAMAFGQPPMATLTGQVVEARSLAPVAGASVLLVPGNVSLAATSDSSGHFRIAAIPVGHYALRVAAVGFDTLEVPELWLRAGKQSVERLELSPSARLLDHVTVSIMARERPDLLGAYPFTVEQSLRWPATFSDPGRLVTAMPGVAGANDEANNLSIRGNSPNANAWMLEGVEIVNPNHTGNAGTPNDMPTLSGGGVTLLSAQMLGTSQLLTGVLPMGRDNALGGVLDLRLRNGNMQEREWTVQAGLLGIDLATEGPIGKGGRSSYLANYRYSTIGLLGAMGVDFGDEAITFQDLSFHVVLPAGKRGELHLFGLGGNSSNRFKAVRDTAQWEVDKDGRDIDYTAQTGAAGARFSTAVGTQARFSATLAVSEGWQQRTEDRLSNDFSIGYHDDAKLYERKLAGTAQVDGAAGTRFRYAAGISVLERGLSYHEFLTSAGSTLYRDQEPDGWLVRPWVSGRYSLTERLEAQAGLGLARFTNPGETVPEPRACLQWHMRKGRTLALSGGLRAQMPFWQNFRTDAQVLAQERPIGPTRSRDVVLGYDHPVNERLVLHVEAYHQELTDVPVTDPYIRSLFPDHFSLVNAWNEPVDQPLAPEGRATNYGVEAGVDHRFSGNLFYRANVSVFRSLYDLGGETAHASRWDRRYIANMLFGKEFKREAENRVRTWGTSLRLNLMGGLLEQAAALDPPPAGDDRWDRPMPQYVRLDVRVYLKTDRKGRTGMWAVDLQNVLGNKNVAFHYFDARQGRVMAKYQLGLIPNLSYRIEF